MATYTIDKIDFNGNVYQIQDSNALKSHQTIKQDGVTGATINRFGVCNTASGTADKLVSITTGTFALEAGAKVTVKFADVNTAASPTLNVNSTGAKNIFHQGSQITDDENVALLSGTVDFVYDGTQWQLVGNNSAQGNPEVYSGTKYQYIGQNITLDPLHQPTCYLKGFKKTIKPPAFGSASWQGMDIYGDLMFRTVAGGQCAVYDISNNDFDINPIAYFNLGSYTGNSTTNHADCLCFSQQFYSSTDSFPLLYVTAGDENHAECFVERITRSGNAYSATLIQTITINFNTFVSYGYKSGFPWVQFHVYNGYLYTIGHMNRANGNFDKVTNQHYFTKMNLPSISRSSVTLTAADVEEQWTTNYEHDYMQGCRFKDGKVYMVMGHGNQTTNPSPNYIEVYSLATKQRIAEIDLTQGTYKDWIVQACAIYNDKLIVSQAGYANTFSVTFAKAVNKRISYDIGLVTKTSNGLMSAQDKTKLDTIFQAETNFLFPRSGTYNNQVWYGGGFLTRGGVGVFFTLPFPGAIHRWNDISITCTELRVRKASGYLIENISESTSGYSFTYTGTPLGINVSVIKDSQIDSSLTHAAVGIQFTYNLTINPISTTELTSFFNGMMVMDFTASNLGTVGTTQVSYDDSNQSQQEVTEEDLIQAILQQQSNNP